MWPAVGFLAGAVGGSLLAIGQAATQVVVAADALIGAVIGVAAGVRVCAINAWRDAR